MATIDPLSIPWDSWQPAEAARLLAPVKAPWYVAAGWAIDLFLGEQAREHSDLEIAAPSDRFDSVAGRPYGRPDVVLLFKAKHAHEENAADLPAVLPRLDAAAREWLAEALAIAHPGHAWLVDVFPRGGCASRARASSP